MNAGVIVECADLDDLVGRVEDSLRNFNGNARVVEARARHLMQTRDAYLPIILAKIMQLTGEDTPVPDSDLDITQNGKRVKIMHPDSNWVLAFFYNEFDLSPKIKNFDDFGYFSKFKESSFGDILGGYINNNNIIKKEIYSPIDDKKINKIYNIYDTDRYSNYIKKPLFEEKRKKPLADDDLLGGSLMLGEHPSDSPLKKPKKQTFFGLKEISSSLLAEYKSLP